MNYPELIGSWIYYLNIEELVNLKVKVDTVKNYQLYCLNRAGSIVLSEGNSLKIVFSNSDLLNAIAEKRVTDDNQKDNYYLLFPLVVKRSVDGTFFYPIFIIPFSEEAINFLKVDIPNTNSEEWLVKKFDLSEYKDYIPCKPVFRNIFKVSDEEFDCIFDGKPLITALRELLNLDDNVIFDVAFAEFKNWCLTRLKVFKTAELSQFDFLLWDGKYEYIQTEKVKKQLQILQDNKYDPIRDPTSPAYSYLYKTQEHSFEDYNSPSDNIWLGTFHNYPLSRGQALLIQKYAEKENLIAAQGPPGTGKTTVLMALIAQTIASRAISIVKNGKDYSTILLITSTANKAVENAAREFKDNPELKEFDIYSNGGFYFNYIGGLSSKNFVESIVRLEKIKEYIRKYDIAEAKECFIRAKEDLLCLYEELIACLDEVKRLKSQYETVLAEVKKTIGDAASAQDTIDKLEAELANRSHYIQKEYGFSITEDLRQICLNHQKWLEKYKDSIVCDLDYIAFSKLSNKLLEFDTLELYIYFQNYSFTDRILDLITKKSQKLVSAYLAKHGDIIDTLNIQFNYTIKKETIQSLLKQLLDMCKTVRELLTELKDPILFQCPELYTLLVDYLNLYDQYSVLKEIHQHSFFSYVSKKDGIFELWREKYQKTREFFLASMKVLQYYALAEKDKVVRSLELFVQLFSEESIRARKEIQAEGIENFYRYISLICPIFLSSLNSSPFIYDKFVYKNNNLNLSGMQENFLTNSFKPIYLLFVDEAGMGAPHLAYPAINWSKNVICVGDPLQLEPVVAIDKNTVEVFHEKFFADRYEDALKYSPALISLYHRAARCRTGSPQPDNIGQACFLDYHRRCHPDIANLFCEIAGYKNLVVATPNLSVEEQNKINAIGGKNLIFYDVDGISGQNRNTNYAEVMAVKAISEKLKQVGYDLTKDVGIITPYLNQEFLLQQELKGTVSSKNIGTIHKFQGTEFSVVIMSTVVFDNNHSVNFIDKSPNLLNVAVSRARHLFILVGCKDKLQATRYFSKAIAYISANGIAIEGIEFDELAERKDRKDGLISYVKKHSSSVDVLPDVFSHLEYFKALPQKATKRVLIVSPWIRENNLRDFSYSVLKALESKGVKINIIYGYSSDEQLSANVESILKSITTLSYQKIPTLTHAKIIVVDDSEAIVSSFNWLSHLYYKYEINSKESKAFIRNEVGVITNSRKIIDKIASQYFDTLV